MDDNLVIFGGVCWNSGICDSKFESDKFEKLYFSSFGSKMSELCLEVCKMGQNEAVVASLRADYV